MLQEIDLKIYLISLEEDIKRREKIKELFDEEYQSFQSIKAINGNEKPAKTYYALTNPFFQRYKRIMTPGELGCTLSHLHALETFLSSNGTHALIMEDDVIGTDSDIKNIRSILKERDINGIVFCGCQDGLMNRFKYGYQIGRYLLKIPYQNRKNFSRTAAYLVSREAAKCIVHSQKNNFLTVADFWADTLENLVGDVFYLAGMRHPTDLQESRIESDRIRTNKQAKSLGAMVIIRKIWSRLINEAKLAYHKTRQAKNISDINQFSE